jgi:hypothetical protein
MKDYFFTKGNGVKKEFQKGKFVHVGTISRTREIEDGVVVRTDITPFKHSGNHQYFLATPDMSSIIKKLDGTQARKYFNIRFEYRHI